MAQVTFTGASGDVGNLNLMFSELYGLRNRLTPGTYAIGFDTTPSAWGSSFRAFEFSGGSAVWSFSANIVSSVNTFFDGAWKRVGTGVTSAYQQSSGVHYWYSDVSGAAGSTYTPTERMRLDSAALTPGVDNSMTLGSGAKRWSTVYAGTGTINTSDAREKTAVAPMTVAEIAAAVELAAELGTFKFLAAVEAKGGAARTHVGMTVQRAIQVMTGHGLNPLSYGFICHDEWPESVEQAAGDRYAFRTDELLLFIARGVAARQAALEARVSALEAA